MEEMNEIGVEESPFSPKLSQGRGFGDLNSLIQQQHQPKLYNLQQKSFSKPMPDLSDLERRSFHRPQSSLHLNHKSPLDFNDHMTSSKHNQKLMELKKDIPTNQSSNSIFSNLKASFDRVFN